MFLNGIEQLLRRKIVLIAGIAALIFLGFYWWGISAASSAFDKGELTSWDEEAQTVVSMLRPADAALAAIITAGPLAATLITALAVVLGSSMLPEEISRGRMPFWLSLPQSRLRVYSMISLAPFAVSLGLALLLFGGILGITRLYFPFTSRNLILAFFSMILWLGVVWSCVTALSIILRKVASMVITFFLAGLASMFGGVYELMMMFPGEAPAALVTVARVTMFVFPADRGFRGVLYGIIPVDAAVTENMAFFGVTAEIPPEHLMYGAVWALLLLWLGYLRFRKMDF